MNLNITQPWKQQQRDIGARGTRNHYSPKYFLPGNIVKMSDRKYTVSPSGAFVRNPPKERKSR